MENLAKNDQLRAWKHDDFWQSMDTLRDKMVLEELWAGASPPWKIWNGR
jgi:glucose-1-phosphate cytidylyltransferase